MINVRTAFSQALAAQEGHGVQKKIDSKDGSVAQLDRATAFKLTGVHRRETPM